MSANSQQPYAFISYSTKEKKYGAAVKSALDSLNIESFLAHNDLAVSDEWQRRILRELSRCNIFIPLLSKNFVASEWCSQETGIASNRRGISIVPLSLGKQLPYGFIRKIQGVQITYTDITSDLFIEPLAAKYPRTIMPTLVEQLDSAYSFRGAESIIGPMLPYFALFNRKEANLFAKQCIENNQIWAARLCQEQYLPAFLDSQRDNLTATNKRRLMYQLKNQRPYKG